MLKKILLTLCLLLISSQVHAISIIKVEFSDPEFIEREILSDCEWIDHYQIKKTTVYKEKTVKTVPVNNIVNIGYPGHHNITEVEYDNPCVEQDEQGNNYFVTDKCKSNYTPSLGNSKHSFQTSYVNRDYYMYYTKIDYIYLTIPGNKCKDCHVPCEEPPTTPVPEPSQFLLTITGVFLIVGLLRRKGL